MMPYRGKQWVVVHRFTIIKGIVIATAPEACDMVQRFSASPSENRKVDWMHEQLKTCSMHRSLFNISTAVRRGHGSGFDSHRFLEPLSIGHRDLNDVQVISDPFGSVRCPKEVLNAFGAWLYGATPIIVEDGAMDCRSKCHRKRMVCQPGCLPSAVVHDKISFPSTQLITESIGFRASEA